MLRILTAALLAIAVTQLMVDRGVAQTGPTVFPPVEPANPHTTRDAGTPSPDEISRLKTTVEFEILSGSLTAGLDAQEWVESLKPFGVTVRVRSPKAGDELGVKDNVRGTLRWVIATGELDERGTLKFPDRSFTRSQSTQLKEWIDELKLYGAQGAPDGKPLWGLTYDQFNHVFESLNVQVSNTIRGLTLEAALRELQLPAEMPVRFHTSARQHLDALRTVGTVRPRVQGLSSGTALAAVLADYGLGYRPLRTPAGAMELVIEPLANLRQPWPIGWEPEKDASRGKLAPGLFKMVPVGFNDVPLDDILGAVAEVASIPVVVNHFAAAEKGIDLKETLVSYPQKRAAYMMVLGSIVRSSRLKQELRVDERGVPFVYVTAFVPRTIEDLSAAESD